MAASQHGVVEAGQSPRPAAGLKQACPTGTFVSLAPGDPNTWLAVMFVRDGPYSPAILRFQIFFSDSYPQLPPLITFFTDIFHPLITPLTTYMYTTDIQDTGTVSATDQERLPPGGFSLRHGFPDWFGRGKRNNGGSSRHSGELLKSPVSEQGDSQTPTTSTNSYFVSAGLPHSNTGQLETSVYFILKYIKSTFDTENVLDSVPLNAAGNPGAWQAWRAYRKKLGKLVEDKPSSPAHTMEVTNSDGGYISTPSKSTPLKGRFFNQTPSRRPGDWNWDGVWEDRVKKGVATSLSEPVLYGGVTATDDMMRFLAMDETEVASIKDNLIRTLEKIS